MTSQQFWFMSHTWPWRTPTYQWFHQHVFVTVYVNFSFFVHVYEFVLYSCKIFAMFNFSNFSAFYLFISIFIIKFSVTCNTKSEMLDLLYLILNLEKNASVSELLCASRVRMGRCRNAVHLTIMFFYVGEMRHRSSSCINVFALDNG